LKTLMEQAAGVGMLLLQVTTLCVGAWMAFRGAITIGTLAAFQGLYLSVSNSMLYFLEFTRNLLPARAGMQRIDELLAEPVELADAPDAAPVPPFEQAIEFREVTVAYDGRAALDRVSLRINRGAFVGIIGRSGSGKSTLLSLLMRFRDPDSGQVVVDGL